MSRFVAKMKPRIKRIRPTSSLGTRAGAGPRTRRWHPRVAAAIELGLHMPLVEVKFAAVAMTRLSGENSIQLPPTRLSRSTIRCADNLRTLGDTGCVNGVKVAHSGGR